MTSRPNRPDPTEGQGRRAEEVASWYFRLNGVLQIPGFVLHSDEPRRAITDADLLGVRFPYSQEAIRDIRMTDDRWFSEVTFPGQVLFIISEVKVSLCGVNGPWVDPERGGMEKVIRRFGFAPDELTGEIANAMYDQMFWQNDDFRMQYVSIGQRTNHDLKRYQHLKQLTWSDLANFFFERFRSFGDLKGSHPQWKGFGRRYSNAYLRGRISNVGDSTDFVKIYMKRGFMDFGIGSYDKRKLNAATSIAADAKST